MAENMMGRIQDLMMAIKENTVDEDRDDILDFVAKEVLHFPAYLNQVIGYVVNSNLFRMRYEGEEYRDRMTKLDGDRRSAHIAIADAVNKLNKLSEMYGVEPIVPTEHRLDANSVDDREFAARITFSFCVETFLDEMDRSGYNREDDFDIAMEKLIDNRTHFSEDRERFREMAEEEMER